jgi:hypothetical protein
MTIRLSSAGPNISWFGIGLVLLCLTVATAFTVHRTLPTNTVTLPIEVYPPDGTSEHVESVTLHVSDAGSVDSLYVRAHQPFYIIGGWDQGVADDGFDPEQAAQIRINGGEWVTVRDETVDCAWPEAAFGCVAGTYHTIRFTIPASNAQSGANTIEFKFTGTEGVRSGYRVIGVGLMTPTDPDIQDFDPYLHGAHDGTTFQETDYSTWSPPASYDNSSDIAAGEALWNEQGILDELDGMPIQASCGSCHATDGRDLKFFNYSNRTIIARSRGHGLTEEEGKQIAAYIRSVELEKEDGSPYVAPGRPWNPPYQPGPSGFGPEGQQGPDEADPVYWAAGAGLDWVLDREREVPNTERDMLAYIFPKNGDPSNGVDWNTDGSLNWHHIAHDKNLNLREMPITSQFPDWNNWLPRIHPLDVPTLDFEGSATNARYQGSLQTALAQRDLDEIDREVKRLHQDFRSDNFHNFDQPSGWTDNQFAIARFSAYAWKAMKVWEVFHRHHLENVADDMYCEGNPDIDWCEPLGWMGSQRTLFDVAPHISAPTGQRGAPWIYADEKQEHVFSHLWYQLQMVVNPSTSPGSNAQNPVDVSYQRSHTTTPYGHYDVGQGLKMFASEIKIRQEFDDGFDTSVPNTGWIAWWSPHRQTRHLVGAERGWHSTAIFQNLDAPLRKELLTALYRMWWDFHEKQGVTQTDVSPIPRGDHPTWEPNTYVPSATDYVNPRDYATGIYRHMIEAADLNMVRPGIFDTVATWAQTMWPDTGSEPATEDGTVGPAFTELSTGALPTIGLTAPADGATFTAPSSITLEADPSDPDGSIATVTFFAGDTQLGEDTDAPFARTWSDPAPGTYSLTARATDNDGLTTTSSVVSITVEAGDGATATQAIPLAAGWNLISSHVAPDPADMPSVFDGVSSLEIVRDESGNEYRHENDTNDIGPWSDGESYMVYVTSADTLSLSGTAVAVNSPITLSEGWNFVPYYPDAAQSPHDALGSIADELVMVKDQTGAGYIPSYNIDQIGELKPGQGYKVYVNSGVELIYEEATSASMTSTTAGVGSSFDE